MCCELKALDPVWLTRCSRVSCEKKFSPGPPAEKGMNGCCSAVLLSTQEGTCEGESSGGEALTEELSWNKWDSPDSQLSGWSVGWEHSWKEADVGKTPLWFVVLLDRCTLLTELTAVSLPTLCGADQAISLGVFRADVAPTQLVDGGFGASIKPVCSISCFCAAVVGKHSTEHFSPLRFSFSSCFRFLSDFPFSAAVFLFLLSFSILSLSLPVVFLATIFLSAFVPLPTTGRALLPCFSTSIISFSLRRRSRFSCRSASLQGKCFLRHTCWLNVRPHVSHLCGLSSEWMIRCSLKWSFRLNAFPQLCNTIP